VAEGDVVHPDGGMRIAYNDDGQQIPVSNGGVTAHYWWTQSLYETSIYVDVPPGTRAKDLDISMQSRKLRVALRGGGGGGGGDDGAGGGEVGEEIVYVDGALPDRVRVDESYWNLESNRVVQIVLQKTVQTWWKSVVAGDPEIDTTKVDSTMKIDEYDEETQGAIRKIMFDQKQKQLGLPTSDEMSADDVLERAKGLPGSPFLPGGGAAGT
jgi:hypothetical protein